MLFIEGNFCVETRGEPMRYYLVIIPIVIFIFSVQSFGSEESSKDTTQVICTHGNEKRIIALVKEGSGCKVNYTKSNTTTVIGSQKNGIDFCERLIEKVKAKLVEKDESKAESSGFQCSDTP